SRTVTGPADRRGPKSGVEVGPGSPRISPSPSVFGGSTVERSSPGPLRWAATTAAVVLATLTALPWTGLLASPANANHYWPVGDPQHIATMHNNVEDEYICAQSYDYRFTNDDIKGFLGVLLS